jgi:excisionase family DNA binding protein
MLTVHEAADRLGLADSTLRAWIAQGRIGVIRLGRAVRVCPEEVTRLILENTVPARANQRQQSKAQEVRAGA